MDWKRRFELICGLITGALGMTVMVRLLSIEKTAAQILHETRPIGKPLAIWFTIYGLPGLLVAIGAYVHAVSGQPWGRLVLIAASCFLTIWFFLSLVLIVWSGMALLTVLFTAFAILTSIVSLLVRSKR
jgi:hypothetical protein